ncbi:MAG: hypothetical protein Q8L47_03790 [bacterium]|nr:hypothetical protein [bacterium]
MTKPRPDEIGPYEYKLQKAHERGIHGLAPDEKELTAVEIDILKIEGKYHCVDALPQSYAKKALKLLKLNDTPDAVMLVWAFLKDEINWRLHPSKRKYPRLRLLRSKCSQEIYSNFYNVLSEYVPDLPHPAEDKVIHLTFSKNE